VRVFVCVCSLASCRSSVRRVCWCKLHVSNYFAQRSAAAPLIPHADIDDGDTTETGSELPTPAASDDSDDDAGSLSHSLCARSFHSPSRTHPSASPLGAFDAC
jgi:hypothetical protein